MAIGHSQWSGAMATWAMASGHGHGPGHGPWPWAMAMKTFCGEPCEQCRQTKQNEHGHISGNNRTLLDTFIRNKLGRLDIFLEQKIGCAVSFGLVKTSCAYYNLYRSFQNYNITQYIGTF